jgi:hypothetical protein
VSQTPEGTPVELEADYTNDNGVLTVTVEYGNAKLVTTLDWADEADPGSDFNFLHSVLPTVIARVHQEVTGA